MATLESLKRALIQRADPQLYPTKLPLSEREYSAGFDILRRESGSDSYQDFIVPQLSRLVDAILASQAHISVLEIGPGPKSILCDLPSRQRQKIKRYTAFEPNSLFAKSLNDSLHSHNESKDSLPILTGLHEIRQTSFTLQDTEARATSSDTRGDEKQYDLVLFCHSMYGMKPKGGFIERALKMLVERPREGFVAVFHRGVGLNFDGLVCHRTASSSAGFFRIRDDNQVLDQFSSFIAGFTIKDTGRKKAIQAEWRELCRNLGRRDKNCPNYLSFSSPEMMVVFTRSATAALELKTLIPSLEKEERTVKNREARLLRAASVVRPTGIPHVQACLKWALKHRVGLTVIGGGHSGHCLQSNVVAIDMQSFNQVHILPAVKHQGGNHPSFEQLVVAGAGCKTEDIVHKAMTAGLTVPLGARPSVGAGLWLQGGIGHQSRLHGLSCDNIVGAVFVSVDSGQVFYVGCVPSPHRPLEAVRPENEADLLWAIQGAGTNFGIVISVTFKAYRAATFLVQNWVIPLNSSIEAQQKLANFDNQATGKLDRDSSMDAYLYWDSGQLHLGVTSYKSSPTIRAPGPGPGPGPEETLWGLKGDSKVVHGSDMFDTEMYMHGMHGGHGGGKTSSFKRCLFLKHIGEQNTASQLIEAVQNRPSPLCYLHLLHGGGAISDVAADATAFGCRDWDYACVITSVWPRDQDGSKAAQAAVSWVYDVVGKLLSQSSGVYGADLGQDPRDAALAAKAFGRNGPRLARLKRQLDPHHVLAYACPLPPLPKKPNLIVLVTGESCAGKDHCAELWVSMLKKRSNKGLIARTDSISDVTKQEYAAVSGANVGRLLADRAYKEQHRPALTEFFRDQVRRRPGLPKEHFLDLVHAAADVDVLFITGLRDEAPVATLSSWVPESRLIEVNIQASEHTRRSRREYDDCDSRDAGSINNASTLVTATLGHCPDFIFNNDTAGDNAVMRFAETRLLPLLHEDLRRLADLVRSVSDFPRPGVDFKHVLGIASQPEGLALCTSLLRNYFAADWAKVDAVACCEVGGLVYASALALQVNKPLVLIREAGKLPPPTVAVPKACSYISTSASGTATQKWIEIERDSVRQGASLVVIDDVLSSGITLCSMLQLLQEAGIAAERIKIMVVAEFPLHCGRNLLRRHGFGKVKVQSLLVFGGA